MTGSIEKNTYMLVYFCCKILNSSPTRNAKTVHYIKRRQS